MRFVWNAQSPSVRGVPTTYMGNQRVGLVRSPRSWLVVVHGARPVNDGIDDGPSRFDHVLAREEGRVAGHRVAEEAFVGIHAALFTLLALLDHGQLERRA